MKQAQGLQQKMTDVQAELASVEVEGVSGGGMVKVVATAKGDVKSVTIDPSLMVAEDREILEDLLVTALNDVRTRAERVAQQRMEEVTRGLPLPPGLKLF
jgi:DNA-binding YbaB/EbfC family protein